MVNNFSKFVAKLITINCYCILCVGTIYCPIHWTGISSGIHGIFKGKWYRRSQFCQRNGLPRSVEFSRNIWG